MKILPIFYCFARSGGTMLNQCLGVSKKNVVLSEVNPTASVIHPAIQAQQWFDLISKETADSLAQAPYGLVIQTLYEAAVAMGKSLIIRDWITINFLKKTHPFAWPSEEIEQSIYLEQWGFTLRPVVLARRAQNVYQSLTRNLGQFGDLSQEVFLSAYKKYAIAMAPFPKFHLEDFTLHPELVYPKICKALGVEGSLEDIETFSSYTNCTGNNTLARKTESSGFKEIKRIDLAIDRDEAFNEVDILLGYSNES